MMPKLPPPRILPPSSVTKRGTINWAAPVRGHSTSDLIAFGHAVAEAKDAEIAELRAERDALQSRIDEAREIYAGMDGFIPQTAPEGYLLRIVKQMYDAAMAEKRGT